MPDQHTQAPPFAEVDPTVQGAVEPSAVAIGGLDSIAVAISAAEGADTAEVTAADPFALYGSLGPINNTDPAFGTDIPAPVIEKPPHKVADSLDTFSLQYDQHAEAKRLVERAELGISLDRESIRGILTSHPEILPKKEDWLRRRGDQQDPYETRRAELQKVLDTIASLPENLVFEPGVTIIIGDNGSGKSTLARAIQMRVKAEDEFAAGMGRNGQTKEEYLDDALDPTKYERRSGGEAPPSPMAMLVARHIQVDKLTHGSTNTYFDATVLSGMQHGSILEGHNKIDMDMTHGGSHGQVSGDALGYLRDTKERYLAAKERGAKPMSGPGVVFIDEVEAGLSPRNHRRLPETISNSVIDGSVVIYPTNSIVMYETDVPRIDMDYPELGIHKPADNPETDR